MPFDDMSAYLAALDSEGLLRRVGVPLIFNPFGTRERTATILGERDWRSANIRHADLACFFWWNPPMSQVGPHANEHEFAGALRGAPVELVKCETSDLGVPAHAEYIIEAEMVRREQEPVGWHSNPVGYYDRVQTFPIARGTCITRRKNPIPRAPHRVPRNLQRHRRRSGGAARQAQRSAGAVNAAA